MLGAAALAALLLSNSPWAPQYFSLVNMPGEVRIGGDALVLVKPLVVWVNDLWMAVFFFLVGLEIKREWTRGELADRRQAARGLLHEETGVEHRTARAAVLLGDRHPEPTQLGHLLVEVEVVVQLVAVGQLLALLLVWLKT